MKNWIQPLARLAIVFCALSLGACSTVPEPDILTCAHVTGVGDTKLAGHRDGLTPFGQMREDPLCLGPMVAVAAHSEVDGIGKDLAANAQSSDNHGGKDNKNPKPVDPPASPKPATTKTVTTTTTTTTTTTSDASPAPDQGDSPSGDDSGGQTTPPGGKDASASLRVQYLTAMYEQSVAYCLYYRNREHFWFRVGLNGYDFGDILLAAAVPAASFAHAEADTIGLIGSLVGLFGDQFKTAILGASPGDDFSQTLAVMQTMYNFYLTDPYVIGSKSTLAFNDKARVYRLFKVVMEQSCFSQLTFSDPTAGGAKSDSSGTPATGGKQGKGT